MDTKMTAAQYEVACYIEDLCSFVRQYACITIWATSVVSEQEAA